MKNWTILGAVAWCLYGLSPTPTRASVLSADSQVPWAPGVSGGIPIRTKVFCDPTVAIPGSPLKAVGDGVADCRPALQFALDHCPVGEVVLLPAGNFRLASGGLVINRSITFRGVGLGKTWLTVDTGDDSGALLIQSPIPWLAAGYKVASGATKGSTALELTDKIGSFPAPMVFPGMKFVIQQANDPAVVNINGCTWCADNNFNFAQAQVVVAQTAATGSTHVTFQPPMYWDSTTAVQISTFRMDVPNLVNGGIEDLSIAHPKYYGGGSASVMFQGCQGCWAKNVEIKKAPKSSFKILDSLQCEIRGCYAHDAWNTEGGSAYGYHIYGYNSAHLIEDNIGENLRHTFVCEGGGSGCVIAYNYSRGAQTSSSPGWVHDDLISHGAHPFLNLYEGNYGHKWVADWVHGSASNNTLFRNCLTEGLEPDEQGGGYEDTKGVHRNYSIGYWAVSTGDFNYYMSAIGNVLGWPSMTGGTYAYDCTWSAPTYGKSIYKLGYNDEGGTAQTDAKAATTFSRHGNFDYVTNGVKWDPKNGDHHLPNSLYLTSKPAFFGKAHWPPFGPDQTPMVSPLPAQVRWAALKAAAAK